jgi:hypothetical protein
MVRLVRAAGVALSLVVSLVASGCGSGTEAGTLDPAPSSGADADLGDLKLRNALIVVPEDGDGSGSLVLTIINDGDTEDILRAIELVAGEEAIEADLRPAAITLPAGGVTVIPTTPRPTASFGSELVPGSFVDVVLRFANAGFAELSLPVLYATGPYAATG